VQSPRWLVASFCLALLASIPASVAAQLPPASSTPASTADAGPASLAGKVVKEGAPVAGARVSLHQVTAKTSGMVGQATTDAGGSFSFRLPPPDTSGFNVFFVTVDHESVRYFGAPIHRGDAPAGYTVEVFDTASNVPGAVRISHRGVILLPETDGTWSVNELVRVVNTSRKTVVSAGGSPTFQFPVPQGATDFDATEGDVAAPELHLIGERAVFVGSLVPGARELFVRYRLPAEGRAVELSTIGATDTFDVFIPEGTANVTVTGLTSTHVTAVQNQRFVQYTGTGLPDKHSIRVAFATDGPPVSPVTAGLIVATLVLAAGAWLGYRNRDPLGTLGRTGRRTPGRAVS
jgi:hypothetical protein